MEQLMAGNDFLNGNNGGSYETRIGLAFVENSAVHREGLQTTTGSPNPHHFTTLQTATAAPTAPTSSPPASAAAQSWLPPEQAAAPNWSPPATASNWPPPAATQNWLPPASALNWPPPPPAATQTQAAAPTHSAAVPLWSPTFSSPGIAAASTSSSAGTAAVSPASNSDTFSSPPTPVLAPESHQNSQPPASRRQLLLNEPNEKESDDFSSVSAGGLEILEILKKNQVCRVILKKRLCILDTEERKTILENLAPEIYNRNEPYGQAINHEIYEVWLKKLFEVFPAEAESSPLYLARAIAPSGKGNGVLVGYFVNAVNALRRKVQRKATQAGAGREVLKKAKKSVTPSADPQQSEATTAIQPNPSETAILEFLKNNFGPEDTIIRLWSQSRNFRSKNLAQLDTFPVLRDNFIGIKLLKQDFDAKHYPSTDNLKLKWPSYSEALWKAVVKKKGLSSLNNFIGVPTEIAAAFVAQFLLRAIPVTWVIPNTQITKKQTSTVDENIKSVIIHCESKDKLEEVIFKRVEFHELTRLPLQPFMVVVGLLDNPEAFYLVTSASNKYHFNSFMECFDTCFKIFFALNLNYPVFGYRFWLFVQREIVGIFMPKLDKVSQINDLVAALRPFNLL